MASAISNRIQSNVQSISDKLNAISNNALLRCLSNFRRAHPLLFWLFSPMIVPAASCLVFLSSIILSGIVFLAIFYGILFLLFLPTLLVVLSGPTMLVVCIICTCYILLSAVHLLLGFPTLIIDRLVLIYSQVGSILMRVDQLYQSIVANITAIISTIIRTAHIILTIPRTVRDDVVQTYRQVVFIVMYVHRLYQTLSDKIVAIYRLIVSIITTTYRIVSFMVSIPNQVWTFVSEKSPKERLEDQVREIGRKMEQIIDRVEGRITRVIQETRNTNIINVNITNPALLPEPQIRNTRVTVTDSFHPREGDVFYDALSNHGDL